MQICINEQYLTGIYDELEKKFLKISPDKNNRYAVLKETVIRRFLQYGREDINSGQYERAVYVYNCISTMTEELEKGDVLFWDEVPAANGAKANGYAMVNGDSRPVFYCGYGHFEQVKRDVSEMGKLGCNTIQIEIGPSYVLFPVGTHSKWGMDNETAFMSGEKFISTSGEFEINLAAVKKSIIPVLENAQRENVAVCLLLSPHYAPSWVFEKYPDMRSKNVGFLKYNIYHPKAKEMIETFIRAVVPLVKDYPALQSICISNEPAFNTMYDCNDSEVITHDLLPTEEKQIKGRNMLYEWHKHLKERFTDISELNKLWGSEYKSFTDIGMPDGADNTVQFYEWHLWNNRCFADWHKWMADIVKSIAPDIPVHAKFMPIFGSSENAYHRRFVKYGVDPEQFAAFTDFSGNDAWSFEGRSHLPLSYKLEWYDYLASLKRMPIDNSEDHIIEDRDSNYSPVQAQRIYADMWQGAVHGRTMTQIWVWERSNNPHATANGSILHRPDCVEAVGRAALDLNRLAPEVAAMQDCARRAAILFSKPSRIYNMNYTKELFTAYEGMLYAGLRPYFITEENIGRLKEFELLVVAGASNVYERTAEQIADFARGGRRVIIVDRDGKSLTQDEYGNQIVRDSILEKAIHIDSSASVHSPDAVLSQKITDCILSVMKNDICVKPVNSTNYNIEWCRADLQGRSLINICNYAAKTEIVQITVEKGSPKALKDLISGRIFVGDTAELEPYTPMLIEMIPEEAL